MRTILIGSLAVLLWLVSIVIALYEIVPVRNALLSLYVWIATRGSAAPGQLASSYESAVFFGQIITIALAFVVVGVAVGAGEYHAKHVGDRRSWRLFAWVFGIELLVFVTTYPFA
jgi:hypothetical protein